MPLTTASRQELVLLNRNYSLFGNGAVLLGYKWGFQTLRIYQSFANDMCCNKRHSSALSSAKRRIGSPSTFQQDIFHRSCQTHRNYMSIKRSSVTGLEQSDQREQFLVIRNYSPPLWVQNGNWHVGFPFFTRKLFRETSETNNLHPTFSVQVSKTDQVN